MDPAAETRTKAEMPSATGLYVFAKREGLWDSAVEAIHVGGQTADEAVKVLLQAYHQKQLDLPLDQAVALVNKIPGIALGYYTKDLTKKADAPPAPSQPSQAQPVTSALSPSIMSIWEGLMGKRPARSGALKTDGRQVTLAGRPIFRILDGMVSASWAGKVTLSTASALNALAGLAGIPRPFKVGLGDGEALYHDQPVDPAGWIDLGPGPSHSPAMATASKTAASYPQAIQDKGGDASKVRQALEKAVKALNEASVNALKFDDRLGKLERDTYAIFQEYLTFDQQAQALKAREDAQKEAGQPVTSSLSTPATDERAGEFDHGDVGDEGDSITASASLTDEEIVKAAHSMSLAQAREAYINGTMSEALFDVFVPLWQALHQKDGPAELKQALDRGDIDQHVFELGQKLLADSAR